MSSTTTRYRNEHPEWLEQEKAKDREQFEMMYQDNPEFRGKEKQRALARYYRLKEQKDGSNQVS
jgi:hypothetical protein